MTSSAPGFTRPPFVSEPVRVVASGHGGNWELESRGRLIVRLRVELELHVDAHPCERGRSVDDARRDRKRQHEASVVRVKPVDHGPAAPDECLPDLRGRVRLA